MRHITLPCPKSAHGPAPVRAAEEDGGEASFWGAIFPLRFLVAQSLTVDIRREADTKLELNTWVSSKRGPQKRCFIEGHWDVDSTPERPGLNQDPTPATS